MAEEISTQGDFQAAFERERARAAFAVHSRNLMASRLALLKRAAMAISSKLQVEEIVDELLHTAVPQIADWCAVDLLERGVRKRAGVYHSDPGRIAIARMLDERFPPKAGDPLLRVLQNGKSEMMTRIPDTLLELLSRDDVHLNLLRTLGLRSYAIVPLLSRGTILGAATFVTAETDREYTDIELDTAEQLGALVGLALHNAQLYTQAIETSEHFESLLQCTGEGIYGIDTAGQCTFANPAASEMLGYAVEELLGQNMHALIHHHQGDGSLYPEQSCPIYRAFQAGRGCRISDEVFFTKSHTVIAVNYSSFPILRKGQLTGAVIAFSPVRTTGNAG